MDTQSDLQIRLAAFQWLQERVEVLGEVLPRTLLETGFLFEGERVPLIAPQGIFKPRVLDLPLSITTAPNGPYADSFSADGFLLYKYRGTDPNHRDNTGLRAVYQRQTPLIYFHGLVPGKYLAVWPVYIIGDDPAALTFKVAVDDYRLTHPALSEHRAVAPAVNEERRAYVTALVTRRLHQSSFRERVLQAYREQCALCHLRHSILLDAAHIVPDREPEGVPAVRNGIALCKLHHAAYDAFLLGITPDYVIHIREDVLEEEDGPMLLHGLQGFHGSRIVVPHATESRPDRDLLAFRYERFTQAGVNVL